MEKKTFESQPISNFYADDHDHLDKDFRAFQKLKAKDFPLAKEHFRNFMFGLRRHIQWEDQILFPLFEAKTGLKDSGPTAVMRAEHVQILQALDALHAKVRNRDLASDEEEAFLTNILKIHNHKEECVIYPALDSLSNDAEKEVIFMHMRRSAEGGCGGGGGCCCSH